MARELARRAHGARWLWCLVLWSAAAGCRCPGDPAATPAQGAPDAGEVRVRTAPRRPPADTPDAGRPRLELQGVPRSRADKPAACPAGEHRCCDGSCSPDPQCPGIACDPAPTMSE